MVMAICSRCHLPIPDSFHDFKKECRCVDWKKMAKKNKWIVRIRGKVYDYSKKVKI
jgi:hypothetical protein